MKISAVPKNTAIWRHVYSSHQREEIAQLILKPSAVILILRKRNSRRAAIFTGSKYLRKSPNITPK